MLSAACCLNDDGVLVLCVLAAIALYLVDMWRGEVSGSE
jgi:hypothetical protein